MVGEWVGGRNGVKTPGCKLERGPGCWVDNGQRGRAWARETWGCGCSPPGGGQWQPHTGQRLGSVRGRNLGWADQLDDSPFPLGQLARAVATEPHDPRALWQQKGVLSQMRRPESEIRVSAELVLFGGAEVKTVLYLSPSFWWVPWSSLSPDW